jgi:hypothetical protein
MKSKIISAYSAARFCADPVISSLKGLLLIGIAVAAAVTPSFGFDPGDTVSRDRPAIELVRLYGSSLDKRGWKTFTAGSALTAFRYRGEYREMNVSVREHEDGGFTLYLVSVNINGSPVRREFKIRSVDLAKDSTRLSRIAMPFLLESEANGTHASGRKIYHSKISAGYHRFRDDSRFYPEYRQGSFYFAFDMTYDPSSGVRERHVPLTIGDYFSLSFELAFDNEIRENHYNINLLLYGGQEYWQSGLHGTRFLHGFFMGLEYFRPSGGYTQFTWDDPVYSDHPHIQYIIYRAVSWGCIVNWGRKSRYTFSFMTGVGPSINSSLNATNISPEKEKDLGFIFKSREYGDRRQNFYYGMAFPAATTLVAELRNGVRLEAGHNIYFFTPIEDEKAYDLLNIGRFSPGYHVCERMLVKATYELWHLNSLLRNSTKMHSWNRILIAMEYTL